eukprot:TRINITY_DN9074_c0_g1_i11.p2 TRINITY_DN9074_c0_g1~~TRINITY_DN9074_c0_g1_i11.p2  ORF type:complete len:269 (-),score=-26.14 TRINITY_DN9074_c0_g1_i11:263-1069(-)
MSLIQIVTVTMQQLLYQYSKDQGVFKTIGVQQQRHHPYSDQSKQIRYTLKINVSTSCLNLTQRKNKFTTKNARKQQVEQKRYAYHQQCLHSNKIKRFTKQYIYQQRRLTLIIQHLTVLSTNYQFSNIIKLNIIVSKISIRFKQVCIITYYIAQMSIQLHPCFVFPQIIRHVGLAEQYVRVRVYLNTPNFYNFIVEHTHAYIVTSQLDGVIYMHAYPLSYKTFHQRSSFCQNLQFISNTQTQQYIYINNCDIQFFDCMNKLCVMTINFK